LAGAAAVVRFAVARLASPAFAPVRLALARFAPAAFAVVLAFSPGRFALGRLADFRAEDFFLAGIRILLVRDAIPARAFNSSV
jgi:hypothetical protein